MLAKIKEFFNKKKQNTEEQPKRSLVELQMAFRDARIRNFITDYNGDSSVRAYIRIVVDEYNELADSIGYPHYGLGENNLEKFTQDQIEDMDIEIMEFEQAFD